MPRNHVSKQYAVVLAEYVACFGQVPPSILTERGATELMLEALRRKNPIEPSAEQRH